MTPIEIQQTLNKIHKKYENWETDYKAFDYTIDLWNTILKCIGSRPTLRMRTDETFETLLVTGTLARCLTDNFRKYVIHFHARGYTTSQAIDNILFDDELQNITPFQTLHHEEVCGYEHIKKYLTNRTSYLKPTHPRWPKKKYGEYWTQTRRLYTQAINDMPLTHISEQITKLSEHYTTLDKQFAKTTDPTEMEKLHKCKMQTLAAINTLTRNADVHLTTFKQNAPKQIPSPETETETEN